MATTSTTAGDASNGLIHTAGDDGTYAIKVGAAGSKVNAVVYAADGTPTFLKSGMVLATAQAATSRTSVDFTGIPSWAKKITGTLSGVSTDGAGAGPLWVRLSSATVFQTSGYVSRWSAHGSTGGLATGSQTSAIQLSGVMNNPSTIEGTFTLCKVSGNLWHFTLCGQGLDGSSVNTSRNATGYITLPDQLDGIRFTTSNGTDIFDAGIVNILYEG